MSIAAKIAKELSIRLEQVVATIQLLDDKATIPFIARYRKEATGGLDDVQLRTLDERLIYLRELDARKATILKTIEELGKLTPALEKAVNEADNKARLEDLYLPYKPKRQTKAQIAKDAGLEPLALGLLEKVADKNSKLVSLAEKYLNPDKAIKTVEDALAGAQQILIERFAEHADLLGKLRDYLWAHANLSSVVVKDKQQEAKKFADYFEYQEAIHKIPSHRALALFRGRREGFLRLNMTLADQQHELTEAQIASTFEIVAGDGEIAQWLIATVKLAWRGKIWVKLELDCLQQLREKAEEEAIIVFTQNLRHLLLAAPAGSRVTMGLDPGLRTGVKVVVVDQTGKLLGHHTIFPHAPQNKWNESIALLAKLCEQHNVDLISIGNGTASRETDKLVAELIRKHKALKLTKVVVSEAGASVYSASKLAADEFPNLDVVYRGSVSIARRLQDPLAELVKIDPKSIGVGQYQHDVNQVKLSRSLDGVMQDCVNAVGVDVNTASVPLLTSISGLNAQLAKNIVTYRDEHGAFKNREQLKQVARMGEKTFEQAAGFLRILNGDNPLDSSCVHPESYKIVQCMLDKIAKPLNEVMGKAEALKQISVNDYVSEQVGLPTVRDILAELEKPGRDPRPEFKTVKFKEGVEKLSDLEEGMLLEGVVSNVANFGAFVDIGVHQDGLVHKSEMDYRFVSDPHKLVKVGDIVKVKVLMIDTERNRINLTMKLEDSGHKPRNDQRGKRHAQHAKTDNKHKSARKPTVDKVKATEPSVFGSQLAAALKGVGSKATD